MRLFKQLEDAVSSPDKRDVSERTAEPEPREPDFSDLGGHVAEVLNSAKQAAERIRTEAEEDAAQVREAAKTHAEAQTQAAAERRAEAEEEAERRLTDAEQRADTTVQAAEQEAHDFREAAVADQDRLREETKALERQRDRAIWELRELASQLAEILDEAPASHAGNGEGVASTEFTGPADEADTVVQAPAEEEDTLVESSNGRER